MKWDDIPQRWTALDTTWFCGAQRISYRRGKHRGWIDVVVDLDGRGRPSPSHYDVVRSVEGDSPLVCNRSDLVSLSYGQRAVDISHEAPAGTTSWLFSMAVGS